MLEFVAQHLFWHESKNGTHEVKFVWPGGLLPRTGGFLSGAGVCCVMYRFELKMQNTGRYGLS